MLYYIYDPREELLEMVFSEREIKKEDLIKIILGPLKTYSYEVDRTVKVFEDGQLRYIDVFTKGE